MPVMQSWQMTSYSALSKQQSTLHDSIDTHMITADTLKLDEGTNDDVDANDQQLDRYTFPRGASAGSFLHSILEVLVFDHLSELDEVIEQKGQWFGIDEKWNVMLQQWISDILLSSLGFNKNYCLADLSAHQYMPEMEFYLPLTQVGAKSFNRLLNEQTKWADREYQFTELSGILKGFIDLVYEFDDQYFVADYKSNHLGDSLEYYERHHLHRAMEEHDYHLQGVIYTLALHRWLRQRIKDYDYEKHIGGAVYLFLRGMDPNVPGSGVYYFKPDKAFIMALDDLFSGKAVNFSDSDLQSQQGNHQLGLDFYSSQSE